MLENQDLTELFEPNYNNLISPDLFIHPSTEEIIRQLEANEQEQETFIYFPYMDMFEAVV